MNINELLMEADSIIEKKAAKVNTVRDVSNEDFEITKLADLMIGADIEAPVQVKTAAAGGDVQETSFEKIAHAIAIVETLVNMAELQKFAEFEDKARAQGHSEEKIAEFFEKNAAMKPVHKYVTIPGALLAMGAGAGHVTGKQSGYNDAVNDVNRAMSGQGGQ